MYQKQTKLLQSDLKGLSERDLLIFVLFDQKGLHPDGSEINIQDTEKLRKMYRVNPNEFIVILIGKDGGKKLEVQESILTRDRLYGTIDAMPMRQAEMKRQSQKQ